MQKLSYLVSLLSATSQMTLRLLSMMLSSKLPALHLSKDSDTLLCGYTQPIVGLARSVMGINLTRCYVESRIAQQLLVLLTVLVLRRNICRPKHCATITSGL